jgi:iron complex outermembrane recepter protein
VLTSKKKNATQSSIARLPIRHRATPISAAVCAALYAVPSASPAQQAPPQSPQSTDTLQEVIVTATRREQSLESVPYSLTAITADQIQNTGVTDIASLAAQVPGLSMFDFGARLSGATSPIIRGLNATGESVTRPFRSFEQAPVGTYIDNSPIDGYFQLQDVQRVEVLRGPQGTLYGAGTLGGAIRVIPTAPVLGKLEAQVEGGVGTLAHSDGVAYSASAIINIPLGDTLAFRLSGKYDHEPGFVDVYGIVQRTGSQFYGIPVLADPTDPVDSPAIYYGKKDWNYQDTFTGRASLLWKPSDKFSAQLALTYSDLNGVGGPVTNPKYQGGQYFIDPRITFPAGGDYKYLASFNQPFWRDTSLASLDLSYDSGFATISATTSYYTTDGMEQDEGTYGVGGYPGFNAYYGGTPFNPRFVYGQWFTDNAYTFTQEVRLISNTAPDKKFDYVLGVFYENQTRHGNWYTSTPGSYERSVAQGCTNYYYYGASFPNCLMLVGPNGVPFLQFDTQDFEDRSVFGEFTWHFLPKGQITFGGRHFNQKFTDAQSYQDFPFQTYIPATPHSAPASKNTWKINPSYEFAEQQHVYAIWSQGFRRGGANSVPLTGIFQESPQLSQYSPDSVNNYEVGFKGRFVNGFSYTFALFDMEWDKPQISASLPSGNLAVYNGDSARSRGLELELNGPLFVPGLSYNVGSAYTNAELTSDFSLPANCGCGTGEIVPGLVKGYAGQQLPGSPKFSVAATLNYHRDIAPGYDMGLSLNGTYRSEVHLYLAAPDSPQAQYITPAYGLFNASAALGHDHWRAGLYATNLFDRRVALVPGVINPILIDPNIAVQELTNRPRQIDLRIEWSL